MRGNSNKQSGLLTFFTILLSIVGISVISHFYFFKLDLTSDKRYTLTPESIELLESLDDVVQVKIYLDGNELPAEFVKLKNGIQEILNEFSAYSGDIIEYEYINLQNLSSRKKREKEILRLAELGIPYLPVKHKEESGNTNSFYVTPGVEVFYKGKSIGINLLQTSKASYQDNFKESIESLEYQLTNGLRKLVRERAKNVGFLQLHGESDQFELEDLAKTLSEYYNIGPVFLKNENELYDLNALNLIDLLVISGPKTTFNELELYIIDQFVMRGGKLLCLTDGIYAELDSLRTSPFFPAMPYKSGLDNLLFHYGIRINNDIVEDQQCTQIPINTGPAGSSSKPQLFPWVYFPLIFSANDHLINQNIEPVKMEFASTLDSVLTDNITCTSLLNTSGNNRYIATPTRIGFEDAVNGAKNKTWSGEKKSVALLAEGKFSSYFEHKILPEGVAEKKKLLNSSDSNRIIVIGNGSFANNIVLSDDKTLPLGADRYSNDFYDNKKFLMNCINYLAQDEALITVRSKKIEMRLLDKQKMKEESEKIKLINIALPPVFVLLLGIIIYWNRKKKYT